MVMVSFSDAFDSRGEGFRKLAADLARIVGTGESSQRLVSCAFFIVLSSFSDGFEASEGSLRPCLGRAIVP